MTKLDHLRMGDSTDSILPLDSVSACARVAAWQLTKYLDENGMEDIFVTNPFPSDYASRVENIRMGSGPILDGTGIRLSTNITVIDDDVRDKLEGKMGLDWFFARLDGSADEDDLKKLASDEIVDLLSDRP